MLTSVGLQRIPNYILHHISFYTRDLTQVLYLSEIYYKIDGPFLYYILLAFADVYMPIPDILSHRKYHSWWTNRRTDQSDTKERAHAVHYNMVSY